MLIIPSIKYGFRDYRGGGRSSGETIARVAAGSVAKAILKELGVQVQAYTRAICIEINYDNFNLDHLSQSPLAMPDLDASKKAEAYLLEKIEEQNSSGGVIECIVTGMPAGIGEPVFDKLDASLAKAVMSIGAVKGVEIGDGFLVSKRTGKENNDPFVVGVDGKIKKASNHAGGTLGGISDGSEIIIRAAVKPTASISLKQNTINKKMENIEIEIGGRHDPVIVPRAVVVVESMVAITLVDQLLWV